MHTRNYEEIHMDLFEAKGVKDLTIPKIPIVHCVSSDYALGAGFAREIERRYHIKTSLKIYGSGKYPDCLCVNNIINLVTKNKCYNKPNYRDFETSLYLCRLYCIQNNITEVVMPQIGCGLDKLDWSICRELIIKHLTNCNIGVKVFIKG